jgi:hypothetical protein
MKIIKTQISPANRETLFFSLHSFSKWSFKPANSSFSSSADHKNESLLSATGVFGLALISIKYFFFFALAMFAFSCEEVIDIDLNSSAPQLIAEGLIEKDSVGWVKLSYTTDYFTSEESEYEENATVILTDKSGNSEMLTYCGDGLYKGDSIIGNINDEYTMTIEENGNEYQAVSGLYSAVQVYSVYYDKQESKGPGAEGTNYELVISFSDDPLTDNYYLIKFWVNDTLETDNYTLLKDSYYTTHNVIEYTTSKFELEENDKVVISVYSIDEDAYTYLNELNDLSGFSMSFSTPYNAESNFGSDLLGYFMARSSTTVCTVVQ